MGPVTDVPNPDSLAADEARLAEYATNLGDAIEGELAGFVARCVRARVAEDQADASEVAAAVEHAAARAREDVVPRVRELLAQDIDDQRSNPLSILRDAVRYPTEALDALGIPPVARDADAVRLFPGDVYDLMPGSFADVDPSLQDPGLLWGAAKAHVHLARRRRDGRR